MTSSQLHAQACQPTRYIDELFPQVARTEVVYQRADAYDAFNLNIPQNYSLDIYQPVGDLLTNRPVIFFSFGGAYLIGDKRQPPIPDYCEYFAKRGYVVVALNYRIGFNTTSGGSAERAVYRGVQDLRAAMRYMAQNQAAYRIDLSNVFATGTSAGCVSALHSAYADANEYPASIRGNGILEPGDLGCVDCSGNNDYNNQAIPLKAVINHWGAIADTAWINGNANIPILHIHGDQDAAVPYRYGRPFQLPIWPMLHGSYNIHHRMLNTGRKSVLKTLFGAGHEPELTNSAYTDTMKWYGRDFLWEIMRPEQPSIINGPTTVCVGESSTYTTSGQTGNTYCWNVTGGSLGANSNTSASSITWNTAGIQTIQVSQVSSNQAQSLSTLLQVQVNSCPTGIENLSNTLFGVFPNPLTSDILHIKNETNEDLKYEVYCINGQLMIQGYILANEKIAPIQMSSLTPGSYIVRSKGISNNYSTIFLKK